MTVLLKEQPLQHLRPFQPLTRHQIGPLPQIEQDGIGFGQNRAISQFQNRHAAQGIAGKEFRRAMLSLENIHIHKFKRHLQMVKGQANLVAVR